jgi:hypothetical protein
MITPRFILYLIFLLVILVYGLVNFRKLQSPYKILVILLSLTLISESITRILAYKINNSNINYHFFAPLQLITISGVYILLLKKKWMGVILSVIFMLNILNSIFLQDLFVFPSNALMINSFFIVFLCLLNMYQLLQNPSEMSLFRQSWFWLNIGNILFFTSTYMFFPILNLMIKGGEVPEFIFDVLWIVGMLLYFCYFIALFTNIKYHKNTVRC